MGAAISVVAFVKVQTTINMHLHNILGNNVMPAMLGWACLYSYLVAFHTWPAIKVLVFYLGIVFLGMVAIKGEDGVARSTAAMTSAMPTVQVKQVQGSWKGNDAGSGAKMDLNFYYYVEHGHWMIGHGVSKDMIVVKSGPWVKPATGWTVIWNDKGSGKDRDISAWLPTCGDNEFKALGVFFSNSHSPPDLNMVALVHKDCLESVTLGDVVWSDAGSEANKDLSVNWVSRINVVYPSVATLTDHMRSNIACLTIKRQCMCWP